MDQQSINKLETVIHRIAGLELCGPTLFSVGNTHRERLFYQLFLVLKLFDGPASQIYAGYYPAIGLLRQAKTALQ